MARKHDRLRSTLQTLALPLAAGLSLDVLAPRSDTALPRTDAAPPAADQFAMLGDVPFHLSDVAVFEGGVSQGEWHRNAKGVGRVAGFMYDEAGLAPYHFELHLYPESVQVLNDDGEVQKMVHGIAKGAIFRARETAQAARSVGWLEGRFEQRVDGRGEFLALAYDPLVTDPLLTMPPIGMIRGAFGPVAVDQKAPNGDVAHPMSDAARQAADTALPQVEDAILPPANELAPPIGDISVPRLAEAALALADDELRRAPDIARPKDDVAQPRATDAALALADDELRRAPDIARPKNDVAQPRATDAALALADDELRRAPDIARPKDDVALNQAADIAVPQADTAPKLPAQKALPKPADQRRRALGTEPAAAAGTCGGALEPPSNTPRTRAHGAYTAVWRLQG